MSRKITNLNNSTYIQAAESYCLFFEKDGKVNIKTRPVKFFEPILEANGWCRIHRSYFVNPIFCGGFTENRTGILMQNGKELPISRRKRKFVLNYFKS